MEPVGVCGPVTDMEQNILELVKIDLKLCLVKSKPSHCNGLVFASFGANASLVMTFARFDIRIYWPSHFRKRRPRRRKRNVRRKLLRRRPRNDFFTAFVNLSSILHMYRVLLQPTYFSSAKRRKIYVKFNLFWSSDLNLD